MEIAGSQKNSERTGRQRAQLGCQKGIGPNMQEDKKRENVGEAAFNRHHVSIHATSSSEYREETIQEIE